MSADFQEIRYQGQTVAAVIGEQVIIASGIAGRELALVKAMCAYAVEVDNGTAPGPYSDELAELYATLSLQATGHDPSAPGKG